MQSASYQYLGQQHLQAFGAVATYIIADLLTICISTEIMMSKYKSLPCSLGVFGACVVFVIVCFTEGHPVARMVVAASRWFQHDGIYM
jgi:hypothetical protein